MVVKEELEKKVNSLKPDKNNTRLRKQKIAPTKDNNCKKDF